MNIIRSSAEKLDREDPLAGARDRFVIADPELIYLDGNSLGRLPMDTRDRITQVIDHQWGERLIRSWGEGWMDLPVEIGDRLGASVLGAQAGETIVCDNVTVNIKKLMYSAHAMRPDRTDVIAHRGDFPTDRYGTARMPQVRSNSTSIRSTLILRSGVPTSTSTAVPVHQRGSGSTAVIMISSAPQFQGGWVTQMYSR